MSTVEPVVSGAGSSPPQSPWAFPGLLILSVVARLPYGMGAVGMLTVGVLRGFGPERTGLLATSFTAALAVAVPVWGALADRRGLPLVLRSCVAANLVGSAMLLLPGFGTSAAGAVLLGVGTPPIAATMRATWNRLLPEGSARGRAVVLESILADGVHIAGRIVVAVLAGFAAHVIVLVQALLLAVGGLGLSIDHRLRPAPAVTPRGSTLGVLRRCWPLFLLTLVSCSAHGCVATAFALAPSSAAIGPVLMTAWGIGSVIGGVVFLRWRGGRPTPWVVPVGLAVFALLSLVALVAFDHGATAQVLSACALGLPLAPTFSGLYSVAGEEAPHGRENQTFAVMSSVVVVAFGVGTTVTGTLSATVSPAAAGFGAAVVFTAVALLTALPRARGGRWLGAASAGAWRG